MPPGAWMTWEQFKRDVERQMMGQGLDPKFAIVSHIDVQGWNRPDLRVRVGSQPHNLDHIEVES